MNAPAAPVFISYARSTSREHAEALHAALGDEAFLDTTEMAIGDSIPDGLYSALLGARIVVVFAHETYFSRRYCREEFLVAVAAFDALASRDEASDEERRDALLPIVVALPATGPAPDELLVRLPPRLAVTNWPREDDTAVLADLVQSRLKATHATLADRLASLGQLEGLRAWLREMLPPPRNLAGATIFPLPGDLLPSIGDRFVGRADDLWRVHTVLSTERGGTGAAALSGAVEAGGGYGKTRLALEYLHRLGPQTYPGGLFWVNAEVPDERLEEQLHGILRTLDPDVPDLLAFREADRSVADALATTVHFAATAPMLFVIDNVPEPAGNEAPQPLSTWCPALGEVAVLATSRATLSADPGIKAVPIDVLSVDRAVDLLAHEVDRTSLAEASWREIAEWVGQLPLALELLNSALRSGLDPTELLAARHRSPVEELDRLELALRSVIPGKLLRGVTTALEVSYVRLPDEAQKAARVLAQFGPDSIPLALVDALGEEVLPLRIRAILIARSFLTRVPGSDVRFAGRMHRVLAAFLRARSEDSTDDQWSATAAVMAVMSYTACQDPGAWPLMNACLRMRRPCSSGPKLRRPRIGRVLVSSWVSGPGCSCGRRGHAVPRSDDDSVDPDGSSRFRGAGGIPLNW